MQLVWFRNDLRVHNNPALYNACMTGGTVSAIYIDCPEQAIRHQQSPQQRTFIYDNLNALAFQLAQRGIRLHFLQCPSYQDVPALLKDWCQQQGVQHLHCNLELGFNEQRRDRSSFAQINATCHSYNGDCISPHGSLLTKSNAMYQVYTPFSRAWLKQLQQHHYQILPAPPTIAPALEAPHCPWFTHSLASWPAGEKAAAARLHHYCEVKLAHYEQARDYPNLKATSALSAYLSVGVISAAQCLVQMEQRLGSLPMSKGEPGFAWLNELIWREFYRHLLYATPRLSRHRAFKQHTDYIPWKNTPQHLLAWQQGKTGYPLVDAAMRCLNQTGWMHNRLRMVVASFFTKDLHLDWRLGEAYFMSQLIDGDLAANNGGWQWAASTGADAAPYFRIFNPLTQSKRFDPKGEFIRRWLPELNEVPDEHIHQPQAWLAQQQQQTYPAMIVDHKQARLHAIHMFKSAEALRTELACNWKS